MVGVWSVLRGVVLDAPHVERRVAVGKVAVITTFTRRRERVIGCVTRNECNLHGEWRVVWRQRAIHREQVFAQNNIHTGFSYQLRPRMFDGCSASNLLWSWTF